jgi:hypothetical protein
VPLIAVTFAVGIKTLVPCHVCDQMSTSDHIHDMGLDVVNSNLDQGEVYNIM